VTGGDVGTDPRAVERVGLRPSLCESFVTPLTEDSTWSRSSTWADVGTVVCSHLNDLTCSFMGLWSLTIPVVLLDEADVFLEQRSFANLERNALVSGELHNRGIYSI
jgi:hypothetical protein